MAGVAPLSGGAEDDGSFGSVWASAGVEAKTAEKNAAFTNFGFIGLAG